MSSVTYWCTLKCPGVLLANFHAKPSWSYYSSFVKMLIVGCDVNVADAALLQAGDDDSLWTGKNSYITMPFRNTSWHYYFTVICHRPAYAYPSPIASIWMFSLCCRMVSVCNTINVLFSACFAKLHIRNKTALSHHLHSIYIAYTNQH